MNETINQIAKSVTEIAVPESVEKPNFSYNGLATLPLRPTHTLFGLFGRLDVPPGTWGVCYVPNSDPVALEPGSHWLSGLASKATQIQLVDASRRHHKLPPITATTLDGWEVTIQIALLYEVTDPVKIARTREPIETLVSIAQAALLTQIESIPHETLLGTIDTPHKLDLNTSKKQTNDETFNTLDQENLESETQYQAEPESETLCNEEKDRGLEVIENGILSLLDERPGLEGLRIIDVAVISREGDNRLLEILQGEALARLQAIHGHKTETAQAEREKMRLEMEVQTARASRTVHLIQAETQAQLASIEQQMRLLEAKTEAEVQEVRQVQEAREAERKRCAEEWRTAKELDLRLMEYQHVEALAVIEGTAQITTEAAKNGLFEGIQGNSHRIDLNRDSGDVIDAGIQALRGFREKIQTPTTHFLPRPSGWQPNGQERIHAETIRLDRIRDSEHEFTLRHGHIRSARVWFTEGAPASLTDLYLEITCPDDYPNHAPSVKICSNNSTPKDSEDAIAESEYPIKDWDAQLFIADLVQEILFALVSDQREDD